jgi:hypothetical protein
MDGTSNWHYCGRKEKTQTEHDDFHEEMRRLSMEAQVILFGAQALCSAGPLCALAQVPPNSSVGLTCISAKLKSKLDLKTTVWQLRLHRRAALI